MTIQLIPAGNTLAEGLSELYPNITQDSGGITSDSPELLSGFSNPAATVSTTYKFMFDGGETINTNGMQDFVAQFVDSVAGGATLTEPLNSLSFQLPRDGVYAPLFLEYQSTPLPTIETVVVLGDSIMDQTFGNPAFEDELLAAGYNVTVDNRAVGGNTIADTFPIFDQVQLDYAGSESTTLILLAVGVNDISVYPADAATIQADYTTLMSDISGSGFLLMQSNITKVYPPSNKVSQPYNENIVDPLLAIYADYQLDYYTLTEQNPQWFTVDGIHPDTAGEQGIRDYTIQFMKTSIGVNIPNPTSSLQDLTVNFGLNSIHKTGGNLVNTSLLNSGQLVNDDYSEIVGATFDVTISNFTGTNNSGRGNVDDPTNETLSLNNDELLKNSGFVGDSVERLLDLSTIPFEDDKLYRVGVAATRDVVASDRKADYFVGDMLKLLDASLNPHVPLYWPLQRGIDVKHGIDFNQTAGSQFSYFGGLEIINEDNLKRTTRRFNGTDAGVAITPWSITPSDTIISFKFKFIENGSVQYILDSTTVNNRIRIMSTGELQVQFTRPDNTIESVTSRSLTGGIWYHCKIVITNTLLQLYVDGVLEDSNPLSVTPLDGTKTFEMLGSLTTNGQSLKGELVDVNLNNERIYPLDEGVGIPYAVNTKGISRTADIWNFATPVTVEDIPQFGTIVGDFTGTNLVVGKSYRMDFTISNIPEEGRITALLGDSSLNVTEDGDYSIFVFESTNVRSLFQEGEPDFESNGTVISNIKVFLQDNYGEYQNLVDDDVLTNQLVQDEPTPREIWTPNGTDGYALLPPRTLAGDYYIEATVIHEGAGIRVAGNNSGLNSRVLIGSDGSIAWRPANESGTALSTAAGAIPVETTSTIRVERIGTTGRISIDGTSVAFSGSVPTGDALITSVHRQAGFFGTGKVFDLDINGIDFYPLDDEWTDEVIKPVRNTRLNQLITNGTFDTDLSGWTQPSGGWSQADGKAVLTGSGSDQILKQAGVMTIGKTYTVIFDVTSDSSEIGIADSGGTVIASASQGTVRHTFVADTTDLDFKRVLGTVNGTIDNVYLEERAIYENSASNEWTLA